MAFATVAFAPVQGASRGVRLAEDVRSPSRTWDPEQATGVFIGVRRFEDAQIMEVRYAVDDAIDLAYMFALDRHVRLVPPRRVVLLIEGVPVKEESRRRLEELRNSGATIKFTATTNRIRSVLRQQAVAAGSNGLFVVSLATHGFVEADGRPYLLGYESTFRDHETALSTDFVLNVISQAPRSLVFIDACREHIDKSTRGGKPDPRTVAPSLTRRMKSILGQATFYAAAQGRYAYDDGGNGVFTKAVIDGLTCGATADRGVVTVETLRTFVGREVREWIRKNRHESIDPATQTSIDDTARNMPLSHCPGPPPPPPPAGPARLLVSGSVLSAFDARGVRIWQQDADASIVHASLADLDGDSVREVIVRTAIGFKLFDRYGAQLQLSLPLRDIAFGDVFRKHENNVVALFGNASASRLTIFDSDGRRRSIADQAIPWTTVRIDRPTSSYAPKLIVIALHAVAVMDPKKLTPKWIGMMQPPNDTIDRLLIVDDDNDATRDIVLSTHGGNTFVLDFDGRMIVRHGGPGAPDVQIRLLPGKRTRARSAR